MSIKSFFVLYHLILIRIESPVESICEIKEMFDRFPRGGLGLANTEPHSLALSINNPTDCDIKCSRIVSSKVYGPKSVVDHGLIKSKQPEFTLAIDGLYDNLAPIYLYQTELFILKDEYSKMRNVVY